MLARCTHELAFLDTGVPAGRAADVGIVGTGGVLASIASRTSDCLSRGSNIRVAGPPGALDCPAPRPTATQHAGAWAYSA